MNLRVHFQYLLSTPLTYKSILVPVSYFLGFCSFILSFEIGKCDCSNFVLFQVCFFGYIWSLIFSGEFRSSLTNFSSGNLISWHWICRSIKGVCYLSNIKSSAHEHRIFFFFYLLRSSLISFKNVLHFSGTVLAILFKIYS